MRDVFVVDACRTPMGKIGGQLAHVRPDDLAAHVLGRLLARNPAVDPAEIEDVVWGAANQAGEDNRNVARMAVLLAGLPIQVPGATVNRLCGSGMQAVVSAGHALSAGWGELMIAGGSESMSRAPYVLTKAERGFAVGAPEIVDTVIGWRLVNERMQDLFPPISLGMTAEVVAERHQVSRDDQDEFALTSHQRAVKADENQTLAFEIEPIEVAQSRSTERKVISLDEGPRPDTSLDALAKLPPVFKSGGTVTAGNSSPMNDGASAVLLATGDGLKRHGLTPLARVVASAAAGVHPDVMGIGTVPASEKALARAGIAASELKLAEVNEAFAAQAVATIRLLKLDPEIVNVNGGAIARGHPLGSSGSRLVGTLAHELRRQGGGYGLATMCIGVGQGIAVVLESA
ncbi:MAG: acetyl-CoA C-acyltransferase [Acidimicrobiia bacterium]